VGDGLITRDERHRQIVDVWTRATRRRRRCHGAQLRQVQPHLHDGLLGCPGNISRSASWPACGSHGDPKGDISTARSRRYFREGLTVLEYFISTHRRPQGSGPTPRSARGLRVPTRRLVDVAQDVSFASRTARPTRASDFHVVKGTHIDHTCRTLSSDRWKNPKNRKILRAAGLDYLGSDAGSCQELARCRVESRGARTHDLPSKHVCQRCAHTGLGPRKQPALSIFGTAWHHRGPVDRRAGTAAHYDARSTPAALPARTSLTAFLV